MALLFNNFVINPEAFWKPSYRISPFSSSSVTDNVNIIEQKSVDKNILESYFGQRFFFLENGKSAIRQALQCYNLKPDDEIWIITTTGNKYISGCVTGEIERFCKWSRLKSEKTKVIFVNHEFGFCYRDLQGLKKYNLPIIEDRALSFASFDDRRVTGTVGDFVIYSLPKFFPINYGGVLQVNVNKDFSLPETIPYLEVLMSFYLRQIDDIKQKRAFNFEYLKNLFHTLELTPLLYPSSNECPGVFLFSGDADFINLKTFMQNNGVEASVFYGQNAFFIPVHQNLSVRDMDFFFSLIQYYKIYGSK